jgi:hypothetical protein
MEQATAASANSPPATATAESASASSEHARGPAFRRALRTGLVTVAAFAIGRWWVDEIPLAVFAAFAGIALPGIADFRGAARGRLAANSTAVAAAVGFTALGTWASTQSVWLAQAVMFATVSAIALSGLLGGYATAGSTALIMFYLIAAGSPGPSSEIADRGEGILIGGGPVSLCGHPTLARARPHRDAATSRRHTRAPRRQARPYRRRIDARAGTPARSPRGDRHPRRPAGGTNKHATRRALPRQRHRAARASHGSTGAQPTRLTVARDRAHVRRIPSARRNDFKRIRASARPACKFPPVLHDARGEIRKPDGMVPARSVGATGRCSCGRPAGASVGTRLGDRSGVSKGR